MDQPAQPASRWLARHKAGLAANALAGAVASLLTIAYCLSFSALVFQGPLAPGLAQGLWAFLIGSAIAGLYVALTTTLPPAEAGPDNPAVAVLSVLAAGVSAPVLAAGGSAALAIDHVLVSFTLATAVTGLVLYLIGAFRLAQSVRFIPYPVIGGFLGASGWFLVIGGLEVMIGRDLALADLAALPSLASPPVLAGLAFALATYAGKRLTRSSYVLPIAFLAGSLVLDAALLGGGLVADPRAWFMPPASAIVPWVPLRSVAAGDLDVGVLAGGAIEIGAIAAVTVVALLLDVTGLEVARAKSADLDHEFRSNGIANLIAAPLGGIMGNLSLNGSRLLEETGGVARVSGVVASLVVAVVALVGIDLAALVPRPVLGGLLVYLGLVVLTEVLARSPAHGAWADFALALLIMAVIAIAGYLAGVMFGFVAACLTFAFSYSRIAVIRRHLTRREFASHRDHSVPDAARLAAEGHRIHVFWLSGFIFFGSSNRVFEQIRSALGAAGDGRRRYAVLDLTDVPGFDTSALLSFVKLRNYADEQGIALVFAGGPRPLGEALEHAEFFVDPRPHRRFASRNDALEWCEAEILAEPDRTDQDARIPGLMPWLVRELGDQPSAARLAEFLVRRDAAAATVLYREGSPADTIDLVVAGTLAIEIETDAGALLVRRMSRRTVVGEMGFFRGRTRIATVRAEEASTVYTLDRAGYRRLLSEEPALAARFLEFIVRVLSDRLEFANRGVAALGR